MMRTTRLLVLALTATALTLPAQQPGAPTPGMPRGGAPRGGGQWGAQPQGGVRGGSPAAMMLRARTQLNLTDDQVKRLEALQSAQAARLTPPDQGTQLRLRADLADAMKGEGNLEAARKALTAMQTQRTERTLAMLKARQEARAILTPEQRVQADQFAQSFRARREGGRRGGNEFRGRQGRGGRGGPPGFAPAWGRRGQGAPIPGGWGRPPAGEPVPGTL